MVNRRVHEIAIGDDRFYYISTVFVVAWLVLACSMVQGQDRRPRERLHEPIYRISKTAKPVNNRDASPTGPVARVKQHPLDPALDIARKSLTHIEQNIHDYTCTMVKRERVQGELREHEFMTCKIRHQRLANGREVPFGVYLGFRKPDSVKGREVIYVMGFNDGKIVAHEGGFRGRFLPTVSLLPTSALAMRGQRYPITEIGIKTLTKRLIEKGERDRKVGVCQVRMIDGAKVKDRLCTMLEVRHPDRQPQYDFHLARVFLDSEHNIPIRYEAYDWPTSPGGNPQLIEEYTYMNLKINVGLTDEDFNRDNKSYRF